MNPIQPNRLNLLQANILSKPINQNLKDFLNKPLSLIRIEGIPQPIAGFLQASIQGFQQRLKSISTTLGHGYYTSYQNCIELVNAMQTPVFWSQKPSTFLEAIKSFQVFFDSSTDLEGSKTPQEVMQLVEKLVSLVAEAYADSQKLNSATDQWTLVRKQKPNGDEGWFLYVSKGQWNGRYFWILKSEPYESIPLDLSENRNCAALFERTKNEISFITSKKVLATIRFYPDEKVREVFEYAASRYLSKNFTGKQAMQDFKSLLSKRNIEPNLFISLILYNGSPLGNDKPNCISLNCLIDFNTHKIIHHSGEAFDPSWNTLLRIVEINKKDWIEQYTQLFPVDARVVCDFPKSPVSRYDWTFCDFLLCKELAENPLVNAEMICWIAEQKELEISVDDLKKHGKPEEVVAFEKEGEVDLSPETLIKVMQDQAKSQLESAVREELSATLAPKVIEEDKQAQLRVEGEIRGKKGKEEEEDSSPISNNNNAISNNNNNSIAQKKTPIKPANNLEILAQKLSELNLSPKDASNVESVFKGNPLEAKKFNKLVKAVIEAQMAEGTSASQKGRGSHATVHFKGARGKTGLTLRAGHGSQKGNTADISSQKKTLKNALGF